MPVEPVRAPGHGVKGHISSKGAQSSKEPRPLDLQAEIGQWGMPSSLKGSSVIAVPRGASSDIAN